MALVRRARYITTNCTTRSGPACEFVLSYSWKFVNLLQEQRGSVCWRCKREHRRGDNLVHITINSDDEMKPDEIYHYRCIPSARWHVGKLAGSLPAWEMPSDESPAENVGTSSAADPTHG